VNIVLILGLTGGLDLVFERRYASARDWLHDSAAVLIDDGKIVAAIEEERLNRIKHTNKAPISAIRFCLRQCQVGLEDIDRLAIYTSEQVANERLKQYYLLHPDQKPFLNYRSLLCERWGKVLGHDIKKEKLVFVHHHVAHAMSAFIPSGYERSLVYAVDASGGNGVSAMLFDGEGGKLKTVQVVPESKSLGYFYLNVINYLGYQMWDEYKVMGLAPYGDPSRFRDLFKTFYDLLPEGDYVIHWQKLSALFDLAPPRAKDEPITQTHKDIAASLQEALEAVVFHFLEAAQKKTGHKRLCLAGGVAHNCTLNGKIAYSGIFDDVFVQPAAHDAGCALGAALYALHSEKPPKTKSSPLAHVYLGSDIGDDGSILDTLSRWKDFISFEAADDITRRAAGLLAEGAIIGWAQGRSEFGPRALGNRSILADPRPAENKDIINEMVKKREGFRPFAPSVIDEYVDEYFAAPPNKKQFPFMVFVVKVRKDKQALLGAVTHVDGTARIHTVSRQTNRSFWELINEFGKLTGVYVLLNTSFNNDVEPIVNSAEDAIVSFLTTKLHFLVLGNYLVSRRPHEDNAYLSLAPVASLYARLLQRKEYVSSNEMKSVFEIGNSYDDEHKVAISPEMFDILSAADGTQSLGRLLRSRRVPDERTKPMIDEIVSLWSKRVVTMRPCEISSEYVESR
jgi:carbamoyltransferase